MPDPDKDPGEQVTWHRQVIDGQLVFTFPRPIQWFRVNPEQAKWLSDRLLVYIAEAAANAKAKAGGT